MAAFDELQCRLRNEKQFLKTQDFVLKIGEQINCSVSKIFPVKIEPGKESTCTITVPEPTQAAVTYTESSTQTGKEVRDQATQTIDRWRLTLAHNVIKHNIWPNYAHRSCYVRSKRTQTNPKMFHPVTKGIQVSRLKCKALRRLPPLPPPAITDVPALEVTIRTTPLQDDPTQGNAVPD